MLGYYVEASGRRKYNMVENVMRQSDIKDREIADLFVQGLTGATIKDYLSGNGDVRNQRLCLMVPKLDIPGYTITIKRSARLELVERGYREMGDMLKNFRQSSIELLPSF